MPCAWARGGLGGYVIESAARIGIGHIVAVDFDCFSESNLNRQILSTESNLGAPKAQAAKLRVALINSRTKITALTCKFDDESAPGILSGCDVAVDALDSIRPRLLLQKRCRDLNVPLVHGAARQGVYHASYQ